MTQMPVQDQQQGCGRPLPVTLQWPPKQQVPTCWTPLKVCARIVLFFDLSQAIKRHSYVTNVKTPIKTVFSLRSNEERPRKTAQSVRELPCRHGFLGSDAYHEGWEERKWGSLLSSNLGPGRQTDPWSSLAPSLVQSGDPRLSERLSQKIRRRLLRATPDAEHWYRRACTRLCPNTLTGTHTHMCTHQETHIGTYKPRNTYAHIQNTYLYGLCVWTFVYLSFYNKKGSVKFRFIPLCAGGRIRRQVSLSLRLKFWNQQTRLTATWSQSDRNERYSQRS